MNVAMKPRLLALFAAATLVTLVACADATTSPSPRSTRAPRDTTVGGEGDTTTCRSGWEILMGKVVCKESL